MVKCILKLHKKQLNYPADWLNQLYEQHKIHSLRMLAHGSLYPAIDLS